MFAYVYGGDGYCAVECNFPLTTTLSLLRVHNLPPLNDALLDCSAMNSTGGLPAACIAANPANPSVCIFAEGVSPTLKTPFFPLQSQFDSWQVCAMIGLLTHFDSW